MKNNFIMKKVLFAVVLFVLSASVYAQKDVTRFLGIPIDGSKSEMIRKLKAKGFEISPYLEDFLTGEFNGMDVNINVVTNNNKVYRIFVQDATPRGEGDIIIRFNNLCQQFKENGKYICPIDFTIPDGEDVGYEMTVNNKRYEAAYYQLPTDTAAFNNELRTTILEHYSQDELNEMSDDEKQSLLQYVSIDLLSKRSVWFMIGESYGSYRILMYYDNGYNMANGEDL